MNIYRIFYFCLNFQELERKVASSVSAKELEKAAAVVSSANDKQLAELVRNKCSACSQLKNIYVTYVCVHVLLLHVTYMCVNVLLLQQKRLESSEALCKKLFESGLYWQKRGQRKDKELKDLKRLVAGGTHQHLPCRL